MLKLVKSMFINVETCENTSSLVCDCLTLVQYSCLKFMYLPFTRCEFVITYHHEKSRELNKFAAPSSSSTASTTERSHVGGKGGDHL